MNRTGPSIYEPYINLENRALVSFLSQNQFARFGVDSLRVDFE
ncbi:hypothetical protein DsansV1_C10g0100931 [Dioscorea sansibarensis]